MIGTKASILSLSEVTLVSDEGIALSVKTEDSEIIEPIPTETEDSEKAESIPCLLYTSPSPRDRQKSRMPSSA